MNFEEKLIEAVRLHKFLFDKSDKNYKNLNMKAKTWANISKELTLQEQKVVARWRTLRDRYYREKKKLNLASRSAPEFTTYKYTDLLSFLDDVRYANDSTSGNYPPEPTPSTSGRSASSGCLNQSTSETLLVSSPELPCFDDLIEVDYGSPNEVLSTYMEEGEVRAPSTSQTRRESGNVLRRTRISEPENVLRNAQRQMGEFLEFAKQNIAPQSGLQAFFQSVALQAERANLSEEVSLSLQVSVLESLKKHIDIQKNLQK